MSQFVVSLVASVVLSTAFLVSLGCLESFVGEFVVLSTAFVVSSTRFAVPLTKFVVPLADWGAA